MRVRVIKLEASPLVQKKNHQKQMKKNQNKKVKHQRKAKNRKVKLKLNLHNKLGNLDSSFDKNKQSKQKKLRALLKPWLMRQKESYVQF